MAGQWVSAKEALDWVTQAVGSSANRVIAKRAHAGLIQARAMRLLIDKKAMDNAEVPTEFWWAGGESALEQSWGSGDFSTWINESRHLQAFGVTFSRMDIELTAGIPADDNRWITTKNALIHMENLGGGNRFGLSNQILDYLRIGHIEAKADAMILKVRDRYDTTHDESTDLELIIPDWFWEKCALEGESVLDWQSGIFSGKGYIEGDTYQAKFLGVKLRVSDLSVFAPADFTTQLDERSMDAESIAGNQKPLLSGSKLDKWWQSKSKVRDMLTKEELLALVRAKFPDNHISRDRVRDLIGPRKTGRKPFSGKATAKIDREITAVNNDSSIRLNPSGQTGVIKWNLLHFPLRMPQKH